jgi:hypothetical protein
VLFAEAGDSPVAPTPAAAADRSTAQLALESRTTSMQLSGAADNTAMTANGAQPPTQPTTVSEKTSTGTEGASPRSVRAGPDGGITGIALPPGGNIEAGAKVSSELPGAPSNNITPPPQPSPPPAGRGRMFTFGSTAKPAAIEKSALERLHLSELGALRMLLFLQVQLLKHRFPALAQAFAKASSAAAEGRSVTTRPAWVVQHSVQLLDWQDYCGGDTVGAEVRQAVSDLAEGFALLQKLSAQNDQGVQTMYRHSLSFSEFARSALAGGTQQDFSTSAASEVTAGRTGLGLSALLQRSCSAVDAVLALGQRLSTLAGVALRELVGDVLYSSEQVYTRVFHTYVGCVD